MPSTITPTLETGLNVTEAIHNGLWESLKVILRPYSKFLSVASLSNVGLPVLPLLLYTAWNSCVEQNVLGFLAEHGLNRVQMRSQTNRSSLGGKAFHHLPITDIAEASMSLLSTGASIVAIQPPGNIFRNNYSTHLDISLSSIDVCLEIVGPGFTATDLSKGGLMHERITLSIVGGMTERVFVVDASTYDKNVSALISRFGLKRLRQEHALILEHIDQYAPIPTDYIRYLCESIGAIKEAVLQMDFSSPRAVVAMSWIHELTSPISQPVFWDIHESPSDNQRPDSSQRLTNSGVDRLVEEYQLERR